MRVLTVQWFRYVVNPLLDTVFKTTCMSWNVHVEQIWEIYMYSTYWLVYSTGLSICWRELSIHE